MQPTRRPSLLRISLIAIGVVLLLTAVGLWAADHSSQAAWVAAAYGVILTAGILFERQHYRPDINIGARGWQPTDEKFIDPVTGEPIQVWFNSTTGERDYRPIP